MNIRIVLSFFTIVVLFSELVLAQPSFPGGTTQAPIDGGLGLLAAAGGVYAWKKLRGKGEK